MTRRLALSAYFPNFWKYNKKYRQRATQIFNKPGFPMACAALYRNHFIADKSDTRFYTVQLRKFILMCNSAADPTCTRLCRSGRTQSRSCLASLLTETSGQRYTVVPGSQYRYCHPEPLSELLKPAHLIAKSTIVVEDAAICCSQKPSGSQAQRHGHKIYIRSRGRPQFPATALTPLLQLTESPAIPIHVGTHRQWRHTAHDVMLSSV